MRELLLLVHAGGAALWLGSMAYSLFVVQPRLPRMLGDAVAVEDAAAVGDAVAVEDAQRILAHGNRWPVVGIISVLWLTGIGLVLTGDGTGWWWAAVSLKVVLLAAATGLFWWVSWRGWPRRVFALASELGALQRRFRLVALVMFALVGAAFAIGILLGAGA